MTSQEETTVDIDALKAEAKDLGVTGWQAMKNPEKLQAKIDEAKKGAERKLPPKMSATAVSGNNRNDKIAALEAKDPGCKYITQNAKLTQSEAEAKGFEIIRKENGELISPMEEMQKSV